MAEEIKFAGVPLTFLFADENAVARSRERPEDSPEKFLPVFASWKGPYSREQAVIEAMSINEGIYAAFGFRNRFLPLINELCYIGSSGEAGGALAGRIQKPHHKLDKIGKLKYIYLAEIKSRLTGAKVRTTGGGDVFDFEIAEHALIGLKARFGMFLSLPFNGSSSDDSRRRIKKRNMILINQFNDTKLESVFPNLLMYDLENYKQLRTWKFRTNKKATRGQFREICYNIQQSDL